MPDFIAQSFEAVLFVLEGLGAVLLCLWGLAKRPFFPLKLSLLFLAALLLAVGYGAVVVWVDTGIGNYTESVLYLSVIALCFLAGVLLFRGAAYTVCFCVVLGLSIQFLFNRLYAILLCFIEEGGMDFGAWGYVVRLTIDVPVCLVAYFLLIRIYKDNAERYMGKYSWYMSLGFLFTLFILYNIEIAVQEFQRNYLLSLLWCELFFMLFVLFADYTFLRQMQVDNELAIVKKLWENDRKQFELQKENIEIINIKCHDLRHQIQMIRKNGALSEKMIDDLEEAVEVYDSDIQTNNEVINVLISDLSLRCRRNDIQFTCMIDGEQLNFMEDVDIYSLMGNMLENAFEHEITVQPKQDRFISVVVRRTERGVSIHTENYYMGEGTVQNGIMQTTKADKQNHGFGMLSMKKIVEKYKGKMEVILADDMFQVDILFSDVAAAGDKR